MKKLITYFALLSFAIAGLSAQVVFDLDLGVSYTLDDTSELDDAVGVSVNKFGFPLMVGAGFAVQSSEDRSIILGAKVGFINSLLTLSFDGLDLKTTFSTIPALITLRVNTGGFFTELGAGFHFWTIKATSGGVSFSESDNGFMISLDGGVEVPLSGDLGLRIGAQIMRFWVEDDHSTTLGAKVGLTYGL